MPKHAPCPACQSEAARPLLHRKAAPIYLHPVAADVSVPLPHTVELDYRQCLACGHAFQTTYDMALLENIYRSHYYTPAAEGIATGTRQQFIDWLAASVSGHAAPRSVLEVGCSSGEMLCEVKNLFGPGAARCVGIEPNRETAAAARERGLEIVEAFLTAEVGRQIGPFDLVYSRHVIEHVPDIPAFLASLLAALAPGGRIVLETPSLDSALAANATTGFHIEHLHVFGVQSLTASARRVGLHLIEHARTPAGNLIAAFGTRTTAAQPPATDIRTNLQGPHDARLNGWKEILADKNVVFWGAGSAARELIAAWDSLPLAVCDANPGKRGKRFVGLPVVIEYAPDFVGAMIASGRDKEATLLAASMFASEIRVKLQEMGWRGEVIGLDEATGTLADGSAWKPPAKLG